MTGVNIGSGTTDWTVILSDASIINCCVIRWVKSASLKTPTYGLGIFWKQVYYNQTQQPLTVESTSSISTVNNIIAFY